MVLVEVVVLALVQGIAEFLPISSSGHLVLISAVFEQFGQPLQETVSLNIMLHVGTLAAIVVFYWRRIARLIARDRRVIGLLVAATVPAGVIGPPLRWMESGALDSPLVAGSMLLVTGALLVWTLWLRPGTSECRDLGIGAALLIGVFQAVAILPGVSRSGATIVAGLACGLKREEAAAFSFLLAIPAIAGAGLIESASMAPQRAPDSVCLGFIALGAAISFLVGLAALYWLIRWLEKGRLHHFAWWVFPVGLVAVVWKLFWP